MNIIIALFFITSAHSFSPDQILNVHKKYCGLKVASACQAVQCLADLDTCVKNRPAVTAEEKKAMDAMVDKSKQEVDCLKREVDLQRQKAFTELKPKCEKGNLEACYAKEILEVTP